MEIKYTIDMLNEVSVSVKTQQFATVEGVEYPIGQPHRKAYDNNLKGRQEIKDELPSQQQNAIFSVWGDDPTVNETVTE